MNGVVNIVILTNRCKGSFQKKDMRIFSAPTILKYIDCKKEMFLLYVKAGREVHNENFKVETVPTYV